MKFQLEPIEGEKKCLYGYPEIKSNLFIQHALMTKERKVKEKHYQQNKSHPNVLILICQIVTQIKISLSFFYRPASPCSWSPGAATCMQFKFSFSCFLGVRCVSGGLFVFFCWLWRKGKDGMLATAGKRGNGKQSPPQVK